jgi:hypothetical protein
MCKRRWPSSAERAGDQPRVTPASQHIGGLALQAGAHKLLTGVQLLIRTRRFNATLFGSDGVPFSELAQREGVSSSYFTRVVRLSYLALDIPQAVLDGRQPPDLTTDKLLGCWRTHVCRWHGTSNAPCSA